jgi:hypothetical protein
MRRFDLANTALVTEYSQVMSRGGIATDASREHANSVLGTAFSTGDYAAAVDQLQKEIDAAASSPKDIRQKFEEEWNGKSGGSAKGGKTFDPTGLTSATGPNGAKIYRTPHGWVNENGDPYR